MPELSSQPGRLSIPGLERWLTSPQGRYVLDWEQACLDETVADIFGYNALQIGLPQCDFLRMNRIPLRQTVAEHAGAAVCCEFTALPFASNSIDLIVLPHFTVGRTSPVRTLSRISLDRPLPHSITGPGLAAAARLRSGTQQLWLL